MSAEATIGQTVPAATADRIGARTRLIALFGSPVAHSRSPAMHNAAFAALGLDYVYLAFDVAESAAGRAVDALRLLNARGANVTMPLKRAVCRHLDRLAPSAELVGAVNTIVNDDGVLTGHMTDGIGYLRALEEAGVDWVGSTVTILGVGGAATAVAIELARQGVGALRPFNRRDRFFDEAAAIARLLSERLGCPTELDDLADHDRLRRALATSDLVVNGSPIGMGATRGQSILPDGGWLHPGLVASDLIYDPAETAFLAQARAAGCRTVGGLGMQIHQGAEAFRLWTGQALPLEIARRVAAH